MYGILFRIMEYGRMGSGGFFSYSLGVRHGDASFVSPIAASFPLVTILLARLFLKEKIVFNQVIGIAAIIGGLILISW